jgi:cytochrome c oxidase cbb3-type subunit 3
MKPGLLALLIMAFAATSTAISAPNGEALFATHCAVCHGQDGRGGVGTPLNNESFLRTVSDDYLTKTIRQGRPGRIMPAFETLSDSQVEAIVGHIRGWSDYPAASESPLSLSGDAARGEVLYEQACARCHGEHGEGGSGTGVTFSRPRDLPIIAPALNNSGFLKSASNGMIYATVMNGRAGTPMKPYRDKLTPEEVADITVYIRSFEKTASPGQPETERPPLVLEMESPYSIEQTVENVRNAAIAANFAVIRADHMEHGLVPEGKENPKIMFVDFCNFKFLFEALKVDPRLGMFLPCRVSVVETGGTVRILAVNPLALSPLFNNDELHSICHEMYDMYLQILDEATL